jgi:hypothetical protein
MLPPDDPRWTTFDPDPSVGGSVVFYHSDALAAVPVRAITKPGDNKADPNVETGTYGLFTTCGKDYRSGVVQIRRPYLFFVTRWRERRVLAGYYRIGWWAYVKSEEKNDFALAADVVRFDQDPLPLDAVDSQIGTKLDRAFRLSLRVSEEEMDRMVGLLDGRPDGTDRYLAEVKRLERFNRYHGGHRYIAWKRDEPFTWADADSRLADGPPADPETVSNASPSGWWACTACAHTFRNQARLRACPACDGVATLKPLDDPPTS